MTPHSFAYIFLAYRVSKIGVTALSMAQARQFKHDQREGVIVNAVSRCLNTALKGPEAPGGMSQTHEEGTCCRDRLVPLPIEQTTEQIPPILKTNSLIIHQAKTKQITTVKEV